jgi:hypothetical protein
MYKDKLSNEEELAKFEKQLHELAVKKQTEIVAQLKNLYSERFGSIDDMLDSIVS